MTCKRHANNFYTKKWLNKFISPILCSPSLLFTQSRSKFVIWHNYTNVHNFSCKISFRLALNWVCKWRLSAHSVAQWPLLQNDLNPECSCVGAAPLSSLLSFKNEKEKLCQVLHTQNHDQSSLLCFCFSHRWKLSQTKFKEKRCMVLQGYIFPFLILKWPNVIAVHLHYYTLLRQVGLRKILLLSTNKIVWFAILFLILNCN